jgi:hypothetical protein
MTLIINQGTLAVSTARLPGSDYCGAFLMLALLNHKTDDKANRFCVIVVGGRLDSTSYSSSFGVFPKSLSKSRMP